MPQTEKYNQHIEKVHEAFTATQEKGGMTNKNVLELQKLLVHYYDNKSLEVNGLYTTETIDAVNAFYENRYWTTERRITAMEDKFGKDYIWQSEFDAMQEALKDSSLKDSTKDDTSEGKIIDALKKTY